MAYVATAPERFLGKSVGSGQCVAFARAAAGMSATARWRRGASVRGSSLRRGTAIATFTPDGRYENDTRGRSHAAIYLRQDAVGIWVLDQWVAKKRFPDGRVEMRVQPVHERRIRFHDTSKPVNDGRNYYVIE